MGNDTPVKENVKDSPSEESIRWLRLPARASTDMRLTGIDCHVLMSIGRNANGSGWCFFNQGKLAEEMGVPRPSVNRAVARLVEFGYITKCDINHGKDRRYPQGICQYQLLFDSRRSVHLSHRSDRGCHTSDTGAVTPVIQPSNIPLLTRPLEHTPSCATRAQHALAGHAAFCEQESLPLPEGTYRRVRSQTLEEKAEPLAVTTRSASRPTVGEAIKEDSPMPVINSNFAPFAWAANLTITYGDDVSHLSPTSVDNSQPQTSPLNMAFHQPSDTETRGGRNSQLAPNDEAAAYGRAAEEKKRKEQQPTTTPKGTPVVEICKEGAVAENAEFQLTNTADTVVKAKRKRKTAPKTESAFPFEAFWTLYPRKHGKAPAQKFWAKFSETDRAAAIAGIEPYKRDKEGSEAFIKYGSTYLSQRVWEEYMPEDEAAQTTATRQHSPVIAKVMASALAKYPDDPYCGLGESKLESILSYRKYGGWTDNNPKYDWWLGGDFEPELVALAQQVEQHTLHLHEALQRVRPRPRLRIV